jgi:hypothetical protein
MDYPEEEGADEVEEYEKQDELEEEEPVAVRLELAGVPFN